MGSDSGGGKSSLRAVRDAAYRNHVLEIAEAKFADQGFAATRMLDIAQAAEMSLATLYQFFPGKKKLYRQILIRRDRELLAHVTKGLSGASAARGLGQVLELLELQLRFLLEHPAYLRMQLHDGRLWFHQDARPSEDEEAVWAQGLKMMGDVFAWGIKDGLFVAGAAEDLAAMFLALQQTRLALWVGHGMQDPHDVVVEQIRADFIRFFCRPQVARQWLADDGGRSQLV